jgi:DNA invertase Pin-like site-specific DNA recombinase
MTAKRTRKTAKPTIDPDAPTPACACIRMSSDKQEESPQQQREAIAELARKNNYVIVREYLDPGKSGSKRVEKRTEFLQMIEDSKKGEWKVVLCWDVARFSRLPPWQAAQYKQVLLDNGCRIHSVKEGPQDWETFGGQLIDHVHAGVAHQYAVSLGADSVRGRLDSLKAGNWPNGSCPYGYNREYTDPRTGQQHVSPRTRSPVKGKGWTCRLVVNDKERPVVRMIFDLWVNTDTSMAEIARRLPGPSPSGQPVWGEMAVQYLLRNKAYCGYSYVGAEKHTYRDTFNPMPYAEVAGAHEAIVSEEDWRAAQKKLDDNAEKKTRCHPAKAGALSGILICGHCGYSLGKVPRESKKTGERTVVYRCASPVKNRAPRDKSSPRCVCHQWSVREEDWLEVVSRALREQLDAIKEEQNSPKPPDGKPTGLDALNEQIADLSQKLERAGVNLALAEFPADHRRISEAIRQWEEERAEAEQRKARMTVADGAVTQFNAWYESIKDDLVPVARDRYEKVHADGTVDILFEDHCPLPRSLRNEYYRRCGAYGPDNPGGIIGDVPAENRADESVALPDGESIRLKHGFYPESSRYRSLLKQLGCSVTFTFKRKTVKGGESAKDWEVASAILKINGNEASIFPLTVEGGPAPRRAAPRHPLGDDQRRPDRDGTRVGPGEPRAHQSPGHRPVAGRPDPHRTL